MEVVAGRGIRGDRFFGRATRLASSVSFVAAEALEAVEKDLGLAPGTLDPRQTRRNVVTRGIDLNGLVGQEFQLGTARCIGRRLCEPCSHLQRLTGRALLRPLVHRGGLRADVLVSGVVSIGDAVRA